MRRPLLPPCVSGDAVLGKGTELTPQGPLWVLAVERSPKCVRDVIHRRRREDARSVDYVIRPRLRVRRCEVISVVSRPFEMATVSVSRAIRCC